MRCFLGGPEALENELAAALRAGKERDPLAPIAAIVGGSLQRPYLQRRMATLCDGILNVHFLMPGEMALKLGERALVSAGRRPLPPLADRILLRQIAADQPGYFEPVGQAPGFADALHRLVRELRAAGLEPEEFSASLADACEVPEKAEALAAIYERFLELRSEFFGPDDALLAAEFENPPWTELHAVGLTNPPVALRAALAGLAEHIPVTAYLPTTDTEADVATLEFRDWLTSVGATVDAAPPPTAEPTTLSHARDGLFAEGPSEAPTLDGTLRLLSAPDPTREIREVARTCLEWARAGVNFHEMAIAYRHPDTYRATIEAVFQEAGIPLYLHEGSPLIERPLGRRIMSLLELTEDRFERRAVIEFLSEARLPDETWKTYERFHSSRWDRVSRDAGIVEGRKQWEDRLTATILDLESRDDQERWKHSLADTHELRKFMRDLMAAIDALPARGSWGQHLEALTALLRTYVKDADPVLDALEGMQRVDALGSEVGAEEFRELVRSALEGMRSDDVRPGSSGAFGRRGVNVLDVNSLQLLRFKAVAIVGLVERSFPSPPRPDPLLLDPERINLNAASGKPLQLRVLGPDTEPLQFSLATAAAGEQLLVTFPRKAQGEAKPQLPSPYFRAVAEAVVGHNVAISAIDTLPPALFTRAAGSRIGAADLATALSLPERDRTLIEAKPEVGRAALLAAAPRMKNAFEQRRARLSDHHTPYDGVLPPGVAQLRERFFSDDRQLSASAVGTYAACPQKFFLGNFLGLRKIEEPESIINISALDRGTLIHRILERFLKEEPAKGEERIFGPGEPDRLLGIAREEANNVEQLGQTGYPLAWQYAQEEVEEDLVRWLELEREDPAIKEFPSADYETRFGKAWRAGEPEGELSTDDVVELDAPGLDTPVRIGGRIDRLAWNEDRSHFRIIDYKTGKSSYAPDDGALVGGGGMQLPIYLRAGELILDVDLAEGVTGSAEYHYSTRRGDFARSSFTSEDLEGRRDDIDLIIRTIVGGIRGGRFQMEPESSRACGYCDFDRLCPTGRRRQIERKAGDPVSVEFAAMRETE